jgi:NAD(P)-dependent dehydrogenase (short-subunit alcohol dehydrogenase family)/acyl carrier protein
MAVLAGELGDHVPAAAVWGLLGSAQAEYPGRITLVDVDDHPASWRTLAGLDRYEQPQLALRSGAVWRLGLTPAEPGPGAPPPLDPEGTVLITGAGGALARQVARHLVAERGVRYLLLLGRRGADAPGMAALTAELAAGGAHAEVVACDVADRVALAAALATVPPERPVTAIVHAAGVVDDALLADVTGEQVERVLRPKVDGALNLLELTRDLPLVDVVWFSSATALVGNAGQAAYAAANAALDALARRGRAAGRPVRSLAWGPWADPDSMAGRLAPTAAEHIRRLGVVPLTTAEGLTLLDATAGLPDPVLLALRVDRAAIARARPDQVPWLLAGLAPTRAAGSTLTHASPGLAAGLRVADGKGADGKAADGEAAPLRDRLAGLAEEERARAVLHLVLAEVARVLGHGQPDEVDARQPFLDLGFTSLTAVELRNELSALTGLRLPATLVFEFPTPVALARHLISELAGKPLVSEAATPLPPVSDDLPPLLALEPIQ